MEKIKAKDLNLSAVMIDSRYVLPVIKKEDIPYKQPIYLVLKTLFDKADDDDEIPLGFSNIINSQIRLEYEKDLITVDGLHEKKKNLTVIF